MQTDKISASNKKKQIFVPPKQIIGIVVLKYRFYCYICAMFRIVHILFCGLLLCTSVSLSAQSRERITREEYIEEYAPLAIEAQEEYGIPASITLAQGLLESDNGNSRLATEANNHFGIKCKSNWTGGKVYHDDDEEDECFRAYRTAEESYEDHSIFLATGQRYAFLFDLEITDYEGWAHGLKSAGYATNPAYAERLIKIITDNQLYRYDDPLTRRGGTKPGVKTAEEVVKPAPVLYRAPKEYYEWSDGLDIENYTVPMSSIGGYGILLNNGTRYIVAREGDTLKGLSHTLGIGAGRLRRLNNIERGGEITEGDIVYIEEKPHNYLGEQTYYIVAEGDTLAKISQRFGVSVKGLKRMNKAVLGGGEPYAGEELRLM